MPRGLIKLTAIANNIEAWRDWSEMALEAAEAGMGELILKYQPPADAGWREIDQRATP